MKEFIKKFTPPFLIDFYHFSLAFLGAIIYQFPSRKLKVIGVTGTKGKSTVVNLIGRILEEAGYKVGWISSLSFKVGNKEWLNPYHLTMPGRFLLQKTLRQMVKENCQYAILEVTSEGILQYRHKFIDFQIAVFTNLAPEHIERHGSFEKYRAAKGKLFKTVKKTHILNLDDKNIEYFLKLPANEKYGYGIKSQESEIRGTKVIKADEVKITKNGSSFLIQNFLFQIPLLGEFNIYNSLAAISTGLSQSISLKTCKTALEKVKSIPGRMELIKEGQNFTVIVDLAHTPNSFEEVFKTIKSLPHKKIISIFGSAGGGRDKWKRPVLGKIAAQYSDFLILCNEDPYDENPLAILEAIEKGVRETGFPKENYLKIEDRRTAIKKGLEIAKEGDIVFVLGKGTEQIMIIGSQSIPWDDRRVVKEELKKLKVSLV
jgi:UDP-N-acetylmuramoyl-L-alanyl-D-glutamate--2,6-diaminopimelate ligase